MLERVIKYSLVWTVLNNFKSRLTERLVKQYIEKTLIPDLRVQGWDQIIFTPHVWFGVEEEQNKNRPKSRQIFMNSELIFFVSNGLYPTGDFLKYFKKLTRVIKNAPDGFLVKLRRTNQTKLLKDTLKEFGLKGGGWSVGGFSFFPSEHDRNEQLQVVEGEIEIVEVKTGKAIINSCQMIDYRKVLEEKYALRFFHVNILSFEKNEFEIEEKLIRTPKELEVVQLQERGRGRATRKVK